MNYDTITEKKTRDLNEIRMNEVDIYNGTPLQLTRDVEAF